MSMGAGRRLWFWGAIVLVTLLFALALFRELSGCALGLSDNMFFATTNFLILGLTLAALIKYASDTNEQLKIEQDRHELELRPVVTCCVPGKSPLQLRNSDGKCDPKFAIQFFNSSPIHALMLVQMEFRRGDRTYIYGESSDSGNLVPNEYSGMTEWGIQAGHRITGNFRLRRVLKALRRKPGGKREKRIELVIFSSVKRWQDENAEFMPNPPTKYYLGEDGKLIWILDVTTENSRTLPPSGK